MSFVYKNIQCYIKPVHEVSVRMSHWTPGLPYIQNFYVKGPGYRCWTPGVGQAFARKPKDARSSLKEMIDAILCPNGVRK
jgi:hypothetical protein